MSKNDKTSYNLFPANGRDRMGLVGEGCLVDFGDCGLCVAVIPGGFRIEKSRLSSSDGRVLGHGEMKEASKFSEKSPDFKGNFVDPADPDRLARHYDVVAWWKKIKSGPNEGQPYLSMCFTEK
ncbi:MAG: hypothetical protein Q7S87_03070 [Agitococcus sp.]|nr:hypothetical protein [Agitococcus sp.]